MGCNLAGMILLRVAGLWRLVRLIRLHPFSSSLTIKGVPVVQHQFSIFRWVVLGERLDVRPPMAVAYRSLVWAVGEHSSDDSVQHGCDLLAYSFTWTKVR